MLCASPTFDFYAGFGQASSGGTQGCTVTTAGACTAYTCNGSTTSPIGVSAGTLTISGGSLGKVTVSPDASNEYTYEAGGTFFTAGQTLTVSASGATVPAFGPVSVVAPGLPGLVAPAAAGAGMYTISTQGDLGVEWTGGSGEGQLIFEAATSSSSSYFTCVWPASEGKADVPQAMLAPLAGEGMGYIIYGQYTATSTSAGAYSISVSALPYSGGQATFE
ncbi:MAG TPA: hypothetical protein VHS09_14975 [Polyangiaceae bacterium]|nr:hypothetical protein [Polyangiaceae bacterium]